MKKLLALLGIIGLFVTNMAFAKEPTEKTTNSMTVKSIQWQPEIESRGENKLAKVKIAFHYEGEAIDIGYGSEYSFNVSCQITRIRRGGTKHLFYETRDLEVEDEASEIEGPMDFSAEFIFTFTPEELKAAQKRNVNCGFGYSNDDFIKTTFSPDAANFNQRFRVRGNAWKKVN